MKNFLIGLLLTWGTVALGQVSSAPQYNSCVFPYKNMVKNPCFESAVSGDRTDANTISSINSTTPVEGKSSLLIDAGTSGHLVRVKLKPITKDLAGGNCQAKFKISGDASLYKAAVMLSSANLTGQYTQLSNVASTTTRVVSLPPFPCGAVGDEPEIEIQATDNAAAAFRADWFYGGECIDCTTAQPPATHLGTLKYAAAASCDWQVTTTSAWSGFTADTDCSTPTVTGSLTAPGTKIPAFVLSVQAGSTYRITAKGVFIKPTGSGYSNWRFSDGTSPTELAGSAYAQSGTIQGMYGLMSAIYKPTTSGSKTIEIQTNDASTNDIYGVTNDLVFEIEQIANESQQAIRLDQTNIPWKNCSSTAAGVLITATTTAPTYGSITTHTCKWRRQGENAEIMWVYNATSGGATGTGGYLFNIPSEIGTIDTTKVTIAPTSITATGLPFGGSIVGQGIIGTTSTGDGAYHGLASGMVHSSTAIALYTDSGAGADKSFPFSSSNASNFSVDPLFISMTFKVPIFGWTENQNAPLLVGSLFSSNSGSVRIEHADIANNGTATISNQYGDWLTSVTRASGGIVSMVIKSGIFSTTPFCICQSVNNSGVAAYYCNGSNNVSPSSTAYAFEVLANAAVPTDWDFKVICIGNR